MKKLFIVINAKGTGEPSEPRAMILSAKDADEARRITHLPGNREEWIIEEIGTDDAYSAIITD